MTGHVKVGESTLISRQETLYFWFEKIISLSSEFNYITKIVLLLLKC